MAIFLYFESGYFTYLTVNNSSNRKDTVICNSWRPSITIWTWFWETCFRCPCLRRRVGPDDSRGPFQRKLSSDFCDARKVSCTLGCVDRGLRYIIFPLYLTLVRLHWDCYVLFLVPHYKKDIDILKCTQWTTKRVRGVKHTVCEERLR